LQRGLPEGGEEVVALEGSAAIPGDGCRQGETQRAKPVLPAAGENPGSIRSRGG
jgi:hypothetical protein